MSILHWHTWEYRTYYYPFKSADVINAVVQKRVCTCCRQEEIIYHYDDQESRFNNRNHEVTR